jgi:hypothetical protein
VWEIHQSSWFTGLVAAIESLMDNGVAPDLCPTCNRDRIGPTRRFRDFVERFSRHVDPTAKGMLYRIRSNVSHGWELFSHDEFPTRQNFNAKWFAELEYGDKLLGVARDVLVNWLRSQPIPA